MNDGGIMNLFGRKKDFERVPVGQLQPGMHVSLAERWWDHPFLLNEFTLETESQIQVIAGLGMEQVLWSPIASRLGPKESIAAARPAAQVPEVLAKARAERDARRDQSRKARERIRHADRDHLAASSVLREAFALARTSPRAAVQKSHAVVAEAAGVFASEADVSIVLLSDRVSGVRLHTHAINVMLLSMLIGRSQCWGEKPLGELGLGALFHDVGLLKVPDAVRLKPESQWSRADRTAVEDHVGHGIAMMRDIPEFPPAAQAVLAMHHEHWDGSGYPLKLAGDKIPLPPRHVAVADRYDELCHPYSLAGGITPAEALARMFKTESAWFDPELLTRFIKAMGIYPPGSLVELSNGAIGLVCGVNRDHTMRPLVTVWQDGTRPEEAPMIDLTIEPELSVARSLRESDLAPEVRDYLNPRARTAYYYARLDDND